LIDDREKGKEESEPRKSFFNSFAPLFKRLQELQHRFRPGAPYHWKKHSYTKRPLAACKAQRRRETKAARKARRLNRRQK
jgi:hypothetical protein